jgi:hypothetical protein
MELAALQMDWELVGAYRGAPKLPDGRLAYGERARLKSEFSKTEKQLRRVIQLVKSAECQGIHLDLQDRRHLNPGRPALLTNKIEAAIQAINKANLAKKIRTTRRRMQVALKKKGIKLALGTIHCYMLALKGKLA